jgi:hypothetical protein
VLSMSFTPYRNKISDQSCVLSWWKVLKSPMQYLKYRVYYVNEHRSKSQKALFLDEKALFRVFDLRFRLEECVHDTFSFIQSAHSISRTDT